MRKSLALAMILVMAAPAAVAQEERETPYWASISASEAMMRAGPGRNFPGKWLYKRADLPIRIVEVYPNWRKVEDPDGEQGWMLVNLLSDTRTALVTGTEPRPMREAPQDGAKIRYLAAPGVVGRLESCANDWCELAVGDRRGHIKVDHIWGVDPGENIE